MPRKMAGSAISRLEALIMAMSTPKVVHESTIHL